MLPVVPGLSRAITGLVFGEITRRLAYEAQRYGSNLILVSPW
ncbi:MAG TPA: hypothetical protein VNL71_12500 [Chloroflexota bacterium]|nr:hypothetical protein [Chloroflexota bacterium]